MKKCFLFYVDICLVVSGVIGAGFATGQEILLYFGGKSPFAVAVFCFCFFFLFFKTGFYVFDNKIMQTQFKLGKRVINLSVLYNGLLYFSCFVILAAMIGGTQTSASISWGATSIFPFIGVAVTIFCGCLSCFQMKALKVVGIVFVPIMIAIVFSLCILDGNFDCNGNFSGSITNSLLYVSMNTVALMGVLIDLGKKYDNKQKTAFGFVAAFLLSVLIFVVLAVINANDFTLMPLVKIAAKNSLGGKIYGVIVLASIITTIATSAYPLTKSLTARLKNKYFASLIVFSSAFAVSILGFRHIVQIFYPIISVFGIGVVAVFMFFNKKSNSIVSSGLASFQEERPTDT